MRVHSCSMIKLTVLLMLFNILLVNSPAFAWPPTYGSEYNFGNSELTQAWRKREQLAKLPGYEGTDWQTPAEAEQFAAKKFADKIKERCGVDCTVTEHLGKFSALEYKVEFKNGYHFNVSIDPNCVEIITSPETLEQLKTFEPFAQKFIFSIAQELGLKGLGKTAHFNIGLLSAFEGNPKAFLKFFINYHNLPELATGVLGKNPGNAPPISHLNADQKLALSKIVDDVNQGKVKTVQKVALRIQSEVYTSTPTFNTSNSSGRHYQGIGVKYVQSNMKLSDDRPFEFRAFRQPENAHERTILAELFEKRMAFEMREPGPIAFLDVPKNGYFTESELANHFRLYLAEAGADWDYFKELLPENLQKQAADAFMSGHINWQSASDLKTVESYTRYLPNSQWLRDRMKSLLNSPEAIASGKVPEILSTAEKGLGANANSHARAALTQFIAYMKHEVSDSELPIIKNSHRSAAQCVLDFLGLGFSRVHP